MDDAILPQIEVETPSVSSFSNSTWEERRQILLEELWSQYPEPESDPAFPCNPLQKISTLQSTETLEEGETQRLGNTEWCKCRKCIPMPTPLESSCCQEINEVVVSIPEGVECITHSESFEMYCVNEQNVRVNTICLHLEGHPTVDPDNNRRLRKTAYRTFTAWIYGYLGKGNRRVIPSCAVNAVRNAFPDPNASYVGFMYSNDYEASEMALE
ncbi:P2X purinoceptor 7-like isoform X2 [Lithobates pipiens]